MSTWFLPYTVLFLLYVWEWFIFFLQYALVIVVARVYVKSTTRVSGEITSWTHHVTLTMQQKTKSYLKKDKFSKQIVKLKRYMYDIKNSKKIKHNLNMREQ
jgi:MFS superfamily sulfate permease-like transporter